MKTAERDMARRLRQEEGLSVREIEQRLGVARSSVSRWVRDVPLSREQRDALLRADPVANRSRSGSFKRAARARHVRFWAQAEGRSFALRGDPVHAAGCMLYWAEGAKARNAVKLSNSDPEMLRFFAAFLRRYFDVPDERFRVRCHLFADHVDQQRVIEQVWLDAVGLPRSCLQKSIVNAYSRSSTRARVGKLPYGTANLVVYSTAVVQHIFGAIQEYGGFERPEWLD